MAHRRPRARLAEGETARWAGASAMIDVSDGLLADLGHVADASEVGFRLDEVPVAVGATLDEALGGGEDYELVVATADPEGLVGRLRRGWAAATGPHRHVYVGPRATHPGGGAGPVGRMGAPVGVNPPCGAVATGLGCRACPCTGSLSLGLLPSGVVHCREVGVMTTKVFLLDDHEVVRRGLRELFESEEDLTVVGEGATAQEALARVPASQPDVAVLDVRLPDGDGVEVCRDLRSAMPELKCLMLTSYADDEALFSAILAGASGYVLKQIKGSDLVSAVRRVAAGESLLDPALTRQVMERLRGENVEDERLARLTAQERNILELIADGKTNRQIADELYLAEKTVKNYVSNLLSKMGFARRTEAAVYAAVLAERKHKS